MAETVPEAAKALIAGEPRMAHLATARGNRPHVAPVWYGYEDDTIEVLTTGTKLEHIESNPYVALSIQKEENGTAKWMVTMHGTATVVRDRQEHRAAAERINPKYGAEPTAWPENTLVRIEIGSCTHRIYGD